MKRDFEKSCAARLRMKPNSLAAVEVEQHDRLGAPAAVLGAAEGDDVDAALPGHFGRRRCRAQPAHWRSARRPCAAAGQCFLAIAGDRRDVVEAVDRADLGRLGDRDRRRPAGMHDFGREAADRRVETWPDRCARARRRPAKSREPPDEIFRRAAFVVASCATRGGRRRRRPACWRASATANSPPCRCRRRTPRPRARRSRRIFRAPSRRARRCHRPARSRACVAERPAAIFGCAPAQLSDAKITCVDPELVENAARPWPDFRPDIQGPALRKSVAPACGHSRTARLKITRTTCAWRNFLSPLRTNFLLNSVLCAASISAITNLGQ